MLRKKKTTRGRKPVKQTPEHVLPSGFWAQVGAVVLIAISILYVVAWFGAGGHVLEWVQKGSLGLIGYAVYVVPFLFTYIAVEIFRAENNRLSFLIKFASGLMLIWFAGLFGLMKDHSGKATGGELGRVMNDYIMLPLVDSTIAAFLYILLILITALFITKVSPITVIKAVWDWAQSNLQEEENKNNDIIKKSNASDETSIKLKFGGSKKDSKNANTLGDDFKLNVAATNSGDIDDTPKKPRRLASLRGSSIPDKQAEGKHALVAVSDPNWQPPSLDILEKRENPPDPGDAQVNAQIIKDTLHEFNIDVEMEGANVGPKVTQYTLRPPSGVKLAKIANLDDNIAYNLAASSLRIEAPIPGKKAVGIEVPNIKAADVRLYGILKSKTWKASTEPLTFAIGKDISGNAVIGELNKMPHLLIAGQTGSGKSVMINTLLTSLLYRNSPSDMKLI